MKLEATVPALESESHEAAGEASLLKRSLLQRILSLILVAGCLLAAGSLVDGWIWSLERVTSTGCEEEALFPIWKFAKGQTVYSDPHSIPFSVSYYNWLFYSVYGGTAKIVLGLFHLEDGLLPVVARSLTIGFSLTCIGILYALLGRLTPSGFFGTRLVRLACSVFLVINPLTGAWLFTARPDIAALTCELAGLWWALRYVDTRKITPLVCALLAGYAAWSFKQNFVHLLGGLGVFLLLRRDWRALTLVASATVGLMSCTLLAGGQGFRHVLVGAQLNCPMNAEVAWIYFRQATGLAPHLVAIAAGLGIAIVLHRRRPQLKEFDLLAAIAIIALGIGFLGASKQGADINYFIPISIFGVLWGLCLWHSSEESPSETRRVAHIVHGAILAMFGLGILGGLVPQARRVATEIPHLFARESLAGGEQPPSGVNEEISRLKRHLKELPSPVFVTDRACNLPWIQGKAPHFVYSYMYPLDKKAGSKMEDGGIGGLIERGYFEAVVVMERNCACESIAFPKMQCTHFTMNHLPVVRDGAVPSLDDGRMHHYRLAFRDGWFAYYLKQKPDGSSL